MIRVLLVMAGPVSFWGGLYPADRGNFRSLHKTLNLLVFAPATCGEISPVAKCWTQIACHPNVIPCSMTPSGTRRRERHAPHGKGLTARSRVSTRGECPRRSSLLAGRQRPCTPLTEAASSQHFH